MAQFQYHPNGLIDVVDSSDPGFSTNAAGLGTHVQALVDTIPSHLRTGLNRPLLGGRKRDECADGHKGYAVGMGERRSGAAVVCKRAGNKQLSSMGAVPFSQRVTES